MGVNPAAGKGLEVKLSNGLSDSLKQWIAKGLSEEEKKSLMESIPRTGSVSFEAPVLNEEVMMTLAEQAVKRDKFFAVNQNIAGSALSMVASVLQAILHDDEAAIDKNEILSNLFKATKLLAELMHAFSDSRKAFITPGFEKTMRARLEKTIPDQFLFGSNVQQLVADTQSLVKVSKQIKPAPLRTNNSLNWKSSTSKKEGSSSNFKKNQNKSATSRKPSKPQQKSHYSQSDPIRNRSRQHHR